MYILILYMIEIEFSTLLSLKGLLIIGQFFSDRCGIDRMVVGFTTTCAISAYHH